MSIVSLWGISYAILRAPSSAPPSAASSDAPTQKQPKPRISPVPFSSSPASFSLNGRAFGALAFVIP